MFYFSELFWNFILFFLSTFDPQLVESTVWNLWIQGPNVFGGDSLVKTLSCFPGSV